MKTVNYLVAGFLFLAIMSAVPSYGQMKLKKITITGYVVDVNHYPVINAIIVINNNETGVVTDERGFYKVKVKPYATSIGIISYTHGILEDSINGRTRINFAFPNSILKQNIIRNYSPKKEEINVGYGTVEKKNLTTPVSKTDGANGRYASYNSIYDMLQGTVPGVLVNKGSIFIRGITSLNLSNEPLFVVDGVPVSSIAEIPPQMVKSIEVLKGSSAAIYGSRGANGVILFELIDAPPLKDDLTLATPGKVPSAVTQTATNIKGNAATLNGMVNANDLSTSVTFEYGTTLSYGSTIAATQSPVTGHTSVMISANVTDLKAGTNYHYRIVATNDKGTIYGKDVTFTSENVTGE
jgi:TonB-dependent SusC/RagA subfamily outer membrane receptor